MGGRSSALHDGDAPMQAGEFSAQSSTEGGVPRMVALRAVVECANADDCTSDQLASLIETVPEFCKRVHRVGAPRTLPAGAQPAQSIERAVMHLGKDRVVLLAMLELAWLGAASEQERCEINTRVDTLLAEEAGRSFMPQVIRSSLG